MCPSLSTQGKYSKSQNCGDRTDVKGFKSTQNHRSFEEQKAFRESDASDLPNRAKVQPQRTDDV